MIKLIKAIVKGNEAEAYTELANVDWSKNKVCHLRDESGLKYWQHAIQSIICGLFFVKLALFCLIWHPIFPNIKPHYATDKLKGFEVWYKELNVKLGKLFNKNEIK